jgi:hypothetical protein
LQRIVRAQLAAVEAQPTLEAMQETVRLRCRLVDAEADAALWRSKLAAARTERERINAEMQLCSEGLKRA